MQIGREWSLKYRNVKQKKDNNVYLRERQECYRPQCSWESVVLHWIKFEALLLKHCPSHIQYIALV